MGCCRMRLTKIVAFVTIFDHPVRVWSLIQCPLKDIRFIYSFQEILESVGVRDQARYVEVSTTAVTRAMIIFVSTRCPISKNESHKKC